MNDVSADNLSLLERRYRTTVVILLAQIFVTLILIAAAQFTVSMGQANVSQQSLTTLWVAVLFIAVISFMLRRMFFGWERLKNIAILKGVPGLLGSLQTNSLILGGLAVTIAVIGLMIATFSGNSFDMLRAAAIALIVFLFNFPRKNVWKKIVANLESI